MTKIEVLLVVKINFYEDELRDETLKSNVIWYVVL
jgi:hypothetical protein